MAASPSVVVESLSPIVRSFGATRFHADGEILALSYGPDGSLWSVEDPGILRRWDDAGQSVERHFLLDIETNWFFSAQAKLLAAACDELLIWEVPNRQPLA